ncbi:MAG: DUF1822 family protein, partial [Okeania sp. SIO2H7]|nr:DUF1822 family protein [Okeania sp. SIO2H7]
MKILETNKSTEPLTFTVPISGKFKRQAELFRDRHLNASKARSVYYNTLAVLAVDFYCQCMGIKTNLKGSDSWSLIMQTMADVADLCLENIGFLECRPVLPESDKVEVPAEVWSDRVGYLAVRFNEELTEAKIIGFLPQVESEEIPLSRWRSLEYFLEEIDKQAVSTVTKLSQWLEGVFDKGWQSLETIAEFLDPKPQDLAWHFRKPPTNTFGGVKLIELEKTGYRLALSVKLIPVNDEEFDVEVEVFQTGNNVNLPEDLKLAIIDKNEESVMQAIARQAQSIQLDFSAESDELFQVKLSL